MATYYVRPDGNNVNAGTGYLASQAWATLSKAATVATAGDTVYIAPGTYRESVVLNNGGSSGSPITFQGDRKCQYFIDMSKGDVIISGLNTESDTTITRGYGFGSVVKNYINITNIDIENVYTAAIDIEGTNINILNCNMVKGIIQYSAMIGASSTVINSKLLSISQAAIYCIGTSIIATNCIIKSEAQIDVIRFAGAYTMELDYCIIEGSYIASTANTTLNLYGCIWSCGISSVATISIQTDAAGKNINAKGTLFIGRGSNIQIATASTLYGSKFKDCNMLTFNGGVPSIIGCEFEGAGTYGLRFAGIGATFSGCYFKNCSTAINGGTGSTSNSSRFYANSTITSGGLTNNSPTYGEIDVMAGAVASTTSPLSGTKSLKIAGYDYAQAYVMWIPCEAGKAKTVKIKVKQNSATAGTYIRFGDQTVSPTNNTTLQTLSITYTHHKNELVPLWICPRVNSSGGDFIQFDDVA